MSQADDGHGPRPCCVVSGNTLSASEPRLPQLYTEGSNQLGGGFQILRYPEGAGQLPPTPEPLLDAGPRAPLLREGARLTCLLLGVAQFLYSPALLGVLTEQAALTVLARSLRDPSPEVRVLSLQGLGNILFHPEKVRGAPRRAHTPAQAAGARGTDEAHCIGAPALSLPAMWLGMHTLSGPPFPICRTGLGDLLTGLRER